MRDAYSRQLSDTDKQVRIGFNPPGQPPCILPARLKAIAMTGAMKAKADQVMALLKSEKGRRRGLPQRRRLPDRVGACGDGRKAKIVGKYGEANSTVLHISKETPCAEESPGGLAP
jgi:hypothetical protein